MKKINQSFGLFETMRAYHQRVVYFKEHLKRINRASKLMKIKIPYTLPKLQAIINARIKKSKFRDAYVKLIVTKVKSVVKLTLEVKKYHPFSRSEYKAGFAVMVSSFWKDEHHPLARIKTTDRLLYEISFQEAKARGFAEAIMLNSRGLIAEGTRTNVFFVRKKILYTPALRCGCLEGITKMAVLDLAKKNKLKIKQGNFTVHDLLEADEAFLTNSLIGVMPLTRLGNVKVGKEKNKLTQFLAAEYNKLLTGK